MERKKRLRVKVTRVSAQEMGDSLKTRGPKRKRCQECAALRKSMKDKRRIEAARFKKKVRGMTDADIVSMAKQYRIHTTVTAADIDADEKKVNEKLMKNPYFADLSKKRQFSKWEIQQIVDKRLKLFLKEMAKQQQQDTPKGKKQ